MTLMEKLEQATEGSLELDKAFALAIFPNPQGNLVLRPYTRSIDVALTKTPKGWTEKITHWVQQSRETGKIIMEGWGVELFNQDGNRRVWGDCPTAALALCVAILKARATEPIRSAG